MHYPCDISLLTDVKIRLAMLSFLPDEWYSNMYNYRVPHKYLNFIFGT
jgi:hypothetical protein